MFGNLKDINDKGVIIMKNNFDTNELSVLTEVCNILKKHICSRFIRRNN